MNSFNIRDKQRCRQTISKGQVTFRPVIVGRSKYKQSQSPCMNMSHKNLHISSHSATILTNTIAGWHIFFSETKINTAVSEMMKWYQKPTRPILHYSLVLNMDERNFTNFKNSYKINENSYIHNFLQWRSGEKEDLYQRKKLGGRG